MLALAIAKGVAVETASGPGGEEKCVII